MAFGSISLSYEREMAVDFSYPYDSTATGIVSKKPGRIISGVMALFGPFQPLVWAAIAVAFVFFVPTYWVSNINYNIQQNSRISFYTALYQCYQCMLMKSNYISGLLGEYKVV